MSEAGDQIQPPETGKVLSFKHPHEGKFIDPQAVARVEREKAWGEHYMEGINKIAEGADPNQIALDWAINSTNIEDTSQKTAQRLSAAQDELLTDEKTDRVGNERKFLEDLETALKLDNTGLLILDLDGFKAVNDTLGHDGGDAAIDWFNKIVESKLRRDAKENPERLKDEIYHLHGDEHAILLYNVTPDVLREIAERVRVAVQEAKFEHNGESRSLTTSIGGTMVSKEAGVTGNIKAADIGLYLAKTGGKNRTEIVQQGLEAKAA